MAAMAGTARLLRFSFRRDRWMVPLCVIGLVAWTAMYAASYKGLYGSPAALEKLAASMQGNAAVTAMIGPPRAIDTLPGVVVWEAVPVLSILTAIFSLFMVTRHSRMEEEDGRTDLVLATGAGRLAPLAAALALTCLALVATAVGIAAVLIVAGFDPGQSVLSAAAILGCGLVFAGTTAFCAQLTGKARLTRGLAGGVLGLAWAVRAVGDLGSGDLTWLSPLGWAQLTHPFSGGRWWVLVLPAGAAMVTVALAAFVLRRRDIGAGLIQPRPGPPRASRALTRPLGLALRLQRGTVVGWLSALAVYGLVIGGMGNSVEGVLNSSPAFKEAFLKGAASSTGAALLDSYFASLLVVLAILAAAFTIGAALRPHSEETRGRAELPLLTPIGRVRWAGEYILIAAIASLGLITLLGTAIGVGLGVSSGDFSRIPALAAGGAVQAPAMWVTGGIAVFLFGVSGRLGGVAWGFLAACLAVWSMSSFGNLPGWLNDLSPFTHTPLVPYASADPLPLFVMTLIAGFLAAAGLALFRRRDLA